MVGRRATRVRSLANIPTRRARCASAPTSPHGGEASYASSIFTERPHPASYAVRPLPNVPTRRARCASAPTSPHGGEASCESSIFSEHPHPASSLRELADLPTWWGGELREFDL